ncbi:DUF7344 domain-containing protein [Haladaptatus sp. NG-WS-4]
MNSDVGGRETTGPVSTDEPASHASLDTVLDALANPYRRRLLFALLENNPQDGLDVQRPAEVTESDVDMEQLEIRILHSHLPMLDDAGLIEWNRDTNDVVRGPQFAEIRPFLRSIQKHVDNLPDELHRD